MANVSSKKTDGIDVSIGYSGGDSEGFHYGASLAGTYILNFKQKSDPTAPAIQCAGRFGSGCNIEPISNWKHVMSVNLGYHGVNFQTRWRFLGPVKQDIRTDILKSRIPSFSYFDQTVSIDLDKRFTFRVGVQNIFNKKSPIVGDTVGNDFIAGSTFPVVYDVLGRTFFGGVTASF